MEDTIFDSSVNTEYTALDIQGKCIKATFVYAQDDLEASHVRPVGVNEVITMKFNTSDGDIHWSSCSQEPGYLAIRNFGFLYDQLYWGLFGTATLVRGDKGDPCLYLKRALNMVLPTANIPMDNKLFGERTEGAVKQIQRRAGLPVTGQADTATKQILITYVNDVDPGTLFNYVTSLN